MRVEVIPRGTRILRGDAERAIAVPFSVGESGQVQILDVFAYGADIHRAPIGAGRYALLFETGHDRSPADSKAMWARFTFIPDDHAAAEILVADAQLQPPETLALDARPI